MPAGSVYQPTTVSYEARNGLLAQTSPMKVLRKPMPQICLLILALISLAAGITMIVSGAADYADTEGHKEELEVLPPTEGLDIGLIVGGVFILLFAFVLFGLYVKVADWRRNCVCPCGLSKKQGLARQLQGTNGGPIIALNPSTDPLVSHTQYAPVSEIPARGDEEERHTLMTEQIKECLNSGADESDRMLDSTDPRIVLRPIGHVEDA